MGRSILAFILALGALFTGLLPAAGTPDIPPNHYTPRPAAVAGIRTPVFSLNGTWSFNPAPPKGFETLTERSAKGFKPIEVPGDWTMQGHSVKPGTAAGYLKTVIIPADWRGAKILLRSDSAQSLATFWVNGKLARTHEGGFTAFEMDVTGLCRPGAANTIAAAVQNESTADILASGTQYASYQFGGPTRKVTLFAVPAFHITKIDVATDVGEDRSTAAFRVEVEAEVELISTASGTANNAGSVDLVFSDPGGRVVHRQTRHFQTLGPAEYARPVFEGTVENAALWDPEHPALYTMTLVLSDRGREIETVVRRVGLREIEVAGTRLFVNGRPVKLRGINRHEVHPLRGRSLTPELWRKDAELFRAANMNYIRTSHYPPAEEFLDACDELGLFVECEAPLVWVQHGANETWKREDPNDPKYLPYIKRAVAETVAFNKHHPSIIFWSLANESGWSPHFAEAAEMVRVMDPSRPRTFHDQAYGGYNNRGSDAIPIANYHYPGPQGPDLAVSLRLPRPLLYGEYCHLNCYNRAELAADPGLRDEYGRGFARMWEKIFGSAEVIGGAIWSGIDDVFFLPSGRATGYGEWGPIDGWRREKPEYWHIKKSYSPVRIGPDRVAAPQPGEPIVLQIENRHDFTDLRECRIDWRIGEETGRAAIELPPRASAILRIRPAAKEISGKVLRIDVTSPRGFVIDSTGIAIGEVLPPAPQVRPLVPEAGPVELQEDAATLTVKGGDFSWAFDRKTGALLRAVANGVPILSGGPALMILPQISGACTTDYRQDVEPFNDGCKSWAAESVSAAKDADAVTVTVRGAYAEASGWYAVRIDGAGRAELSYEFKVRTKTNPRQYGLVVYLPRPFDTLSWSRRAQWPAYPENHIGRPLGSAKALSPGREPVFGKEPAWAWKGDQNGLGSNDFRSTKANIIWAVLSRSEGEGLMLSSDGRHAARAFLDGDRVGWLIADFSTGGGDIFFAPHHKMDDRPLEAGDTISGKFALTFVTACR